MAQMEGANARDLQQRITNKCSYQIILHLTSDANIATSKILVTHKLTN